jgi:hypothetical protein
MRRKQWSISSGLAVSALCALSASAQPIGQWDFNSGTLAGTVGAALDYADGAGGTTQQGTAFGTTTSFGLPNIGGTEAQVIKVPKTADSTMGFVMPVASEPTGGGLVNDYTLIFDILFPAESHSKWRAMLDADYSPAGSLNADAEFFVNNGNGIGISGNYSGSIGTNTWYRIGLVMNSTNQTMSKYINGVLVGTQPIPALDDRFALTPNGTARIFSDNDGETEVAYVNSIQLRNVALSVGEMRALAGPGAAGIQQMIPPVPSIVERFIPASAFASRTTPVGGVIDAGSTTIQDSSISLRLNGNLIANPTITRDGTKITVQSAAQNLIPGNKYTNVVAYTDSLNGAQSATNVFTAAVFYEDFNSLELGPNIEEASAGEKVWTNQPPAGWAIDNTNMLGFGTPDDDGDGRPDGDGRSEWFGWAFADVKWWPTVDNQDRALFTLASGAAAIADPDEWDDGPNSPEPFGNPPALFNSLLTTPTISLAGVAANTAFLRFDSSWRDEAQDDGLPKFPVDENGNPTNNQTAIITVSYDGGPEIQVMKWDSVSTSPTFHDDNPNESVLVQLNNPAGAQNMKLTFKLLYGANDWWWAIDNIAVSAGATPVSITKQPVGGLFTAGAQATLSVTASGTEPITYQWQRNGTNIPGATSTTFVINNLQSADAGTYTVLVSNSDTPITSNPAVIQVAAPGPITGDLVVHLKMDGNLTDASGRSNNGTAVGAPTFESGKIGNAVHIPAGTDYVSLGAPTDLNFGTATDFSIAMWLKANAFGGDPSLIGNKDWDSGGNQGYVIFTEGNRRVDWNLAGAPGTRKDGDAVAQALVNNTWVHVVLTFDRDGQAVTYTNGVRAAGSSIAADANNLDTPEGFATNIGQDGAGDYGSVFTDLGVDDLGIWRRVLTVNEVAAIYAAGAEGRDLSTATVDGGGGPQITSVSRTGTNLQIAVTGTGTLSLEKKTTLTDAWAPVTALFANGIFTVPIEGSTGFFRVKSQ